MQAKDNQEQVKFEELSQDKQKELFLEYAKEKQKKEIEKMSQSQRNEFFHLVSQSEQQQLIKERAKKLGEEFQKNNQQSLEEVNEQPSLTEAYLKFKKSSIIENEPQNYQRIDSFSALAKWYYTERASDEFQIKQGVYPPKNITNSGAIDYGIIHSQLRANSYIRAEEENLRAVGYSYQEIDEQKTQIRQTAYQKLDKDWKEEVTRNLEKWLEQKGIKSVESFVSSESQNPSQVKEVKVSDLEAWRQEAEELNRSERHLDKIDRVIESSIERVNKNNPNATVKIDERDFKAMQRDRSSFKQQAQELEQSQNQSVARGRGR